MDTLKDDNKNEIPDIVENLNILAGSTKIIVDGKVYSSLADRPPDVRIRYEKAPGKLAANRNGMPDFLEAMVHTIQTTHVETSFGSGTARRSKRLPVSPAVAPDTSNGWMLALIGLLVLLLCIVLAVIGWTAFMR